jgi:ATP-binding cassette subfamily B protein
LIIAHRLSTIQHVDQIVVLENGTVLESGSPAELRKSDGLYAELLALQDPTTDNTERLKKYDISAN